MAKITRSPSSCIGNARFYGLFVTSFLCFTCVGPCYGVNFDLSPQCEMRGRSVSGESGPRNLGCCCDQKRKWWETSLSCAANDRDYGADYGRRSGPKKCRRGTFHMKGMAVCHRLLTCDDYHNDVVLGNRIGGGAVKQVFKAQWKVNTIVVSVPVMHNNIPVHQDDFDHGYKMLLELGPSHHLVQLLGYCHDPPLIMTEYHPYGNAHRLDNILATGDDTLKIRFRFCLDYVQILAWLHRTPSGARVMCDSSDLFKTLEQFLVNEELRLILNDVDALPLADRASGRLAKCGHRQLHGDFVAPEQLWPHPDQNFDDTLMPGYDQQSDIWKIPTVCSHFVSRSHDADLVLFRLFEIHRACKAHDPSARPTADQVFRVYAKIWQELFKHNDKHSSV